MDLVTATEEGWEEKQRQPCGKEWVEIHQCLTGSKSNPYGGPESLHRCLLGSHHLLDPNGGYIAALLLPEEVAPVASALNQLGKDWLQRSYTELFVSDWESAIPEEHLQELSDLFDSIRQFYRQTAASDRGILFTTDEILEDVVPRRAGMSDHNAPVGPCTGPASSAGLPGHYPRRPRRTPARILVGRAGPAYRTATQLDGTPGPRRRHRRRSRRN